MGKTKIKTFGEEAEETKKKAGGTPEQGVTRKRAPIDAPAAIARTDDGTLERQDPEQTTKVVGPQAAKKEEVSKRAAKKIASKPKPRGKKYQEKTQLVEPSKKYSLSEAIKLAQETSYTKFSGTLEAHINTDSKNIRGLISLPFKQGKKLTILAFGKDADKSGADMIGNDQIITDIESGKINFDVVITTPEWMPKLAKTARVLGPKGLMPNPKSGTITDNLSKTVTELQGGKVEYKTEKDGKVIHLSVGKIDQQSDEIAANIKVLYNTIGRSKVKKITLSPTMGIGVKIDLSSI